MTDLHAALIVAVAAAVTIALRFLPFVIFGENRRTPELITHLGRVLPFAIMGMLVVYCLKGISLTSAPFGIPELLGCAAVAILHIWKRNTLLSIGGGTVLYMLLVQLVFCVTRLIGVQISLWIRLRSGLMVTVLLWAELLSMVVIIIGPMASSRRLMAHRRVITA